MLRLVFPTWGGVAFDGLTDFAGILHVTFDGVYELPTGQSVRKGRSGLHSPPLAHLRRQFLVGHFDIGVCDRPSLRPSRWVSRLAGLPGRPQVAFVAAWFLVRHSRSALFPVNCSQRSTITSQYTGSISSPMQIRPVVSAAMIEVPLPRKGS